MRKDIKWILLFVALSTIFGITKIYLVKKWAGDSQALPSKYIIQKQD